nr:hypothetical protein GCM10025699_27070 [Microbacterium flavescens]
MLIVPDHRDRAQLEAVLAGRVPPEAVVRDDAKQSSPLRYAAFLRTLADAPCIVIGNRSAVYAPVPSLGLVALWDDGDPLLSEPLSPGVHARDAALLRHELDGGALLFAGHTRTTDVERLVAVGWLRDLPAARRPSPRVVLSATREGSRAARACPPPPSPRRGRLWSTDPCSCRSPGRGTHRSSSARSAGIPPAAPTAADPSTRRAAARCRRARGAVVPRAAGRARTARPRGCAWHPRAVSAPLTSSGARSPASA